MKFISNYFAVSIVLTVAHEMIHFIFVWLVVTVLNRKVRVELLVFVLNTHLTIPKNYEVLVISHQFLSVEMRLEFVELASCQGEDATPITIKSCVLLFEGHFREASENNIVF